MVNRQYYNGHYLASATTQTEDGKYQARVAVVSLDGERARSQRFLDFETFLSKVEAEAIAIARGKEWIDAQIRHDKVRFPSRFALLR